MVFSVLATSVMVGIMSVIVVLSFIFLGMFKSIVFSLCRPGLVYIRAPVVTGISSLGLPLDLYSDTHFSVVLGFRFSANLLLGCQVRCTLFLINRESFTVLSASLKKLSLLTNLQLCVSHRFFKAVLVSSIFL